MDKACHARIRQKQRVDDGLRHGKRRVPVRDLLGGDENGHDLRHGSGVDARVGVFLRDDGVRFQINEQRVFAVKLQIERFCFVRHVGRRVGFFSRRLGLRFRFRFRLRRRLGLNLRFRVRLRFGGRRRFRVRFCSGEVRLLRHGLRLRGLCVERLIERLELLARKKRQRGGKCKRQQDEPRGGKRFLQLFFLSGAHGAFVHRACFFDRRQAVGWQFVWHGLLLSICFSPSYHTLKAAVSPRKNLRKPSEIVGFAK